MEPIFLPWHTEVARNWLGHQERFAHAWLIHGLAGIGKREFAYAAAASLLCETPVQGLACGKCLACGWVSHGNHPDLKRIRPEAVALEEGADTVADEEGAGTDVVPTAEPGASNKRAPSKDIRVEQIRSLEPWFNHATHRGGWRVALIYPAETLTTISGNTLLKVLEEPPPSTIFLLVADAPDRLLPTLLSRCRRLPLETPSHTVALNWLESKGVKQANDWLAASGGAPIVAKQRSENESKPCPEWVADLIASVLGKKTIDSSSLADQLAKTSPQLWLDTLQRLSVDLNLCVNGLDCRYFPSHQNDIIALTRGGMPAQFSQLAVWLNEQKRVAGHPLNAKLFAQSVIQRVLQACQIKIPGYK